MNENKLTRRIIAYVKRRGGHASKIHGGVNQRAGISDVLVCFNGYYVALEVKAPENKRGATELQQRFIDKVRAAGGIGEVVRSVKEVKEILDGLG